MLGPAAGALFLVALLTSGVSSSVVGTMAGQVVMQGFIHRRMPVWVRRAVTVVPAFAVVAAGCDVTRDGREPVVLSFVLPLPMIALLLLSARTDVMGAYAMRPPLRIVAGAATVVIVGLNAYLVGGLQLNGRGPAAYCCMSGASRSRQITLHCWPPRLVERSVMTVPAAT